MCVVVRVVCVERLQVSDAKMRNTTTNRLYGPSSVVFADAFVKNSKKHYNYDHSKINLTDKKRAVNSINEWAATSTNGKLPEVTKDVPNADGAMLINAMFFKRKETKDPSISLQTHILCFSKPYIPFVQLCRSRHCTHSFFLQMYSTHILIVSHSSLGRDVP